VASPWEIPVARQAVDLREHRSGATGGKAAPAAETAPPLPPAADDPPPPTPPWRRFVGGVSTAWWWLGGVATGLDAAIGVIRSLIVSLAMIVGVAVGVDVVVMELNQRMLVLEPIELPERLLGLGYTPQMVARELKEKIGEIRQESTTLMKLEGLQGDWEQLDIQIPDTDTTLRQVLNTLRGLLRRPETRISGAIIGTDEIGYTLRLWDGDSPVGTVEVDRERVGEPLLKHLMPVLIADGAESIMAHAEPYVLDLAWFVRELRTSQTDGPANQTVADAAPTGGARLARIEGVLQSGSERLPEEEVPWVYNLLGLLRYRAGQPDAALAAYDKAIAAKAGFAVAFYNRGLVHAEQGDLAAAAADYAQALASAGDGAIADPRDRFGLGVRLACARFHLALADRTDANRNLFLRSRDALQSYEGGLVKAGWARSFFASAATKCAPDELERFLAGSAKSPAT
jgi:tetratricopeptide (TPR) repeat protein